MEWIAIGAVVALAWWWRRSRERASERKTARERMRKGYPPSDGRAESAPNRGSARAGTLCGGGREAQCMACTSDRPESVPGGEGYANDA